MNQKGDTNSLLERRSSFCKETKGEAERRSKEEKWRVILRGALVHAVQPLCHNTNHAFNCINLMNPGWSSTGKLLWY